MEPKIMPCRHIFGDIECETGGRIEPTALFAHPKAEGLFGPRRAKAAEPVRIVEATEVQEAPITSRH